MSRFVRLPTDGTEQRFFNSDHVIIISMEGKEVIIGFINKTRTVVEFDTEEDAKDFIEKNFILFNA